MSFYSDDRPHMAYTAMRPRDEQPRGPRAATSSLYPAWAGSTTASRGVRQSAMARRPRPERDGQDIAPVCTPVRRRLTRAEGLAAPAHSRHNRLMNIGTRTGILLAMSLFAVAIAPLPACYMSFDDATKYTNDLVKYVLPSKTTSQRESAGQALA
jgi:hypothetical protein